MALYLREADVRALLPMRLALDAVEESFQRQADGTVVLHTRHRLHLPDHVFFHYMAAADKVAGFMGLKVYSWVASRLQFVVLLFSARSGQLLAILEAEALGQLRTGAASGVATKYMARQDARTLGIVGTGFQARTQVEAVAAVRKLERVRAFGRNPERRAQFAKETGQQLGLRVEPAGSAEEAVRETDIVVAATTSSSPVVLGKWLAPGAHVNAIGANFPQKRELDEEAVFRAGVIAVDSREQARAEAGDLIQTLGEDVGRWSVVRELAEIVAGGARGRTDARQITLFKSSGIASWDIAVAARVFELAVKRGVGEKLALTEPKA